VRVIIAPDPAPGVAAVLRARTLEQDRGSRSIRRTLGTGADARPHPC
jgi:hypothetical protein